MARSASVLPLIPLLLVAGCGGSTEPGSNMVTIPVNELALANDMIVPDDELPGFDWPDSFRVMGDGYPESGDPCRRLGESAATADYLDHTQVLIGCPGGQGEPAALAIIATGGRVVGAADGVTLISVPREIAEDAQGNAQAAANASAGANISD